MQFVPELRLQRDVIDFAVYPCPKCKPIKTMHIHYVVPMIFTSSSIVTYKCSACGELKDVLEE